jgi:glycosyltransferase involved in cell wall biosynthesis
MAAVTSQIWDRQHRPILIVAPSYGLPVGGVERYIEHLAAGIASRNIAVEVLALDPTHSATPLEKLGSLTIRRFKTFGRPGSPFPSPQMTRWLMGHAADYAVINAHNLHTPLPAVAWLAARSARVPFVLTSYWHGTGHSAARRLLHVPYRPIATLVARSADLVVCNSDAEARLVARDFGSKVRTRVIPIGIDLPSVSTSNTARDAPDGQPGITVLSVGRLERYKQTETLVRTVRHLPPEYRLVVVGSGPEHDALVEAAATDDVEKRVLMRGRCSDEELRAWYGHASVCVSLSEHESFGLVVLEALASGCPVVASDIDAHRELVAFVPPGAIHLVAPDAQPIQIA